ncbi:MAG: adenylate/guanylate cyclase domain-containing protein [Chloroflexi bacterium]|nr:adenylate/guanylate cyclase domain-containing protein [Chloroflexota bacterium]
MPRARTNDETWRAFLAGEIEGLDGLRGMFRRLPSAPRCKICQAPFEGVGGKILRFTPFRRWDANATICNICTGSLGQSVGGTEIEATFLFADIRGSTGVAEHLRPAEYQALLQRFYRVCAMAVDEAGGLVDKFLGDGVVAFFVPVFTGDGGPAASAIQAGRAILDGVGGSEGGSDWLPVGVGVHTGLAYVGVLGTEGGQLDFTGVGDAVNTAARLGSVAGAGELLVSLASAQRANLATDGLERRTLELKGREEPIDVVVLGRTAVAA